jgi:type II secretory pathway pseudopilin PulG
MSPKSAVTELYEASGPGLPMQRFGSGFTLVEYYVVIAIIAIPGGAAFPAFHRVQDQAKRLRQRMTSRRSSLR